MGTIFIRALILYFVVIFSVRLMGKRQLGELQPSELVITILISNIATLPLEDTAIPCCPVFCPFCRWFALKSSFRGFPSRAAVCGV